MEQSVKTTLQNSMEEFSMANLHLIEAIENSVAKIVCRKYNKSTYSVILFDNWILKYEDDDNPIIGIKICENEEVFAIDTHNLEITLQDLDSENLYLIAYELSHKL